MRHLYTLFLLLSTSLVFSQAWQAVGNGTNNSSHGMLVYNGKLVNLGSFNNPCNRVALWNGSTWECLGGGVGIVARAGIVWNGNLVVVGDFWNVQQPCTNCNGVAMWNGTQWTNLGGGFNNDVLCATIWEGNLVVAGDFTQSNGQPCSRIARWTGTTWEQIGPNNAFNNDIRALAVFEDELWAGGDFSNVGGCTSCDGLVKWNGTEWIGGNSGVDLSGGVDTTVRVLYVSPSDGRLYMGGHFRGLTPNGVYNPDLNGVAAYDGSDWFALDQGIGDNPDDYVRAITEYNGQIVVGGYFTSASGLSANKIARYNLTTESWSSMGQAFNGVGVDEYVKSSAVWNGKLFAGGAYTIAEGGTMNHIAQWYEPPSAAPVASINQTQFSVCSGSCVSFSDNSSYNPTTWNWSFPGATNSSSTQQNPANVCYNSPGVYTVTLQACNASGCNTTTATIEVVSTPSVSVNNAAICSGASVVLTADPTTQGGSFLWSPGGQTSSSITVSPSTNTNYTVTYNSGLCGTSTATASVTVSSTAPVVTVNSPSICEGNTVMLSTQTSVPGGTFSWYPSGETTASITVQPSLTSTYTVTYTTGNCSSAPTNSTVTVNSNPTVYAGPDQVLCEGQTTILSGTGANSYAWSNNVSDGVSFIPSTSQTYTLTGIDLSTGCSNTDQVDIVVNPLPIVNGGPDITSCEGELITLQGTGATNYSWDNNVQDGVPFTAINSMLVTVTGADSTNCSNTDQVIVTVNPSSYSTINETAINSYTLNGQTYNQSGTYTQILTNAAGCDSTLTLNLSLSISGLNENGIEFNVFPNPTFGIVTIEGVNLPNKELMLIDAGGRVLKNKVLSHFSETIDLSELSNGAYFLFIENYVVKIIKE
jgi:PKD repeat protein